MNVSRERQWLAGTLLHEEYKREGQEAMEGHTHEGNQYFYQILKLFLCIGAEQHFIREWLIDCKRPQSEQINVRIILFITLVVRVLVSSFCQR